MFIMLRIVVLHTITLLPNLMLQCGISMDALWFTATTDTLAKLEKQEDLKFELLDELSHKCA